MVSVLAARGVALIEGVVEGLELPAVRPVLDPAPGRCCVRIDLKSD
jgi:hypothetical protein